MKIYFKIHKLKILVKSILRSIYQSKTTQNNKHKKRKDIFLFYNF